MRARTVIAVDVLLNLMNIQMCNFSLVSIENLGEFLEGRAFCFDVEKVNENKFHENPDLPKKKLDFSRFREKELQRTV